MKVFKPITTMAICIVFLSCTSFGRKGAVANAADTTGFAVVELFTSEGCSSCPAADALLTRIAGEYKQNLYVMEFHVDYWNYIGWKDVFSSPEYTKRQQRYAKLFQLNSTYTPQAIVNGHMELVGSDDDKLHDGINRFLKQVPGTQITLSAKANNRNIDVSYIVSSNKNEILNIAVVQKMAETDVRRGENSGRKLKHINIVRTFTTIDDGKTSGAVSVSLPEGLPARDVSVIAYTQQKDSWEITGAAEETPNP
jgi:hypothetical protein